MCFGVWFYFFILINIGILIDGIVLNDSVVFFSSNILSRFPEKKRQTKNNNQLDWTDWIWWILFTVIFYSLFYCALINAYIFSIRSLLDQTLLSYWINVCNLWLNRWQKSRFSNDWNWKTSFHRKIIMKTISKITNHCSFFLFQKDIIAANLMKELLNYRFVWIHEIDRTGYLKGCISLIICNEIWINTLW